MDNKITSEELTLLNAQIEKVLSRQKSFDADIRVVEDELQKFSEDRKRFDALRDVCNALDRLKDLDADALFWEGVTDSEKAAEHIEYARKRLSGFEDEIGIVLDKKESIRKEINKCNDELSILYEEVSEAHDREERRRDAYVVEREISELPYRKMIMPWAKEVESERNFRRAVALALMICIMLGGLFTWITVPVPDRKTAVVEIPERLVKLVKEETRKEKILPKKVPQKRPDDLDDKSKKVAKADDKPKDKKSGGKAGKKGQKVVAATQGGGGAAKAAARKKAASVGVLAFKDSFKDLMTETRLPHLGTQARVSNSSPKVRGRSAPQRSLVAMQATKSASGGISGVGGISRNIGNSNVNKLGGIGVGEGGGGSGYGIAQVSSGIANLEEMGRPGAGEAVISGRTDEEIQIVFDRYKATLYRIYNKELRKDPTLRGKILMRITIEPDGAVSFCKAESTDLHSDILVKLIVERIKRFNFGLKEGVEKVTILYPIDFLPA